MGAGAKSAAVIAKAYYAVAAYKGTAAMMIITSVVYLVDFVFGLINLKNVD